METFYLRKATRCEKTLATFLVDRQIKPLRSINDWAHENYMKLGYSSRISCYMVIRRYLRRKEGKKADQRKRTIKPMGNRRKLLFQKYGVKV